MYSLFVTNKHGSLVYQRNFSSSVRLSANDEIRLASTFHSLSAISTELCPVPPPNLGSLSFLKPSGITAVEASDFKLVCLETITGLKLILVSEPGSCQPSEVYLRRVHELYADYVLKNPFYELDMPVRCERFDREIDKLFNRKYN